MKYMMEACLAYAVLLLLMGAVGMTYLLVRMAVAFVKWARQRRQ